MIPLNELLKELRTVLDILSVDIGTTALTYPGTTPAARAYYALSSFYIKLLIDSAEVKGESSGVE